MISTCNDYNSALDFLKDAAVILLTMCQHQKKDELLSVQNAIG